MQASGLDTVGCLKFISV